MARKLHGKGGGKKQEDEQYLEKKDSSVHHTKRSMSGNRFCTFCEVIAHLQRICCREVARYILLFVVGNAAAVACGTFTLKLPS